MPPDLFVPEQSPARENSLGGPDLYVYSGISAALAPSFPGISAELFYRADNPGDHIRLERFPLLLSGQRHRVVLVEAT